MAEEKILPSAELYHELGPGIDLRTIDSLSEPYLRALQKGFLESQNPIENQPVMKVKDIGWTCPTPETHR